MWSNRAPETETMTKLTQTEPITFCCCCCYTGAPYFFFFQTFLVLELGSSPVKVRKGAGSYFWQVLSWRLLLHPVRNSAKNLLQRMQPKFQLKQTFCQESINIQIWNVEKDKKSQIHILTIVLSTDNLHLLEHFSMRQAKHEVLGFFYEIVMKYWKC